MELGEAEEEEGKRSIQWKEDWERRQKIDGV